MKIELPDNSYREWEIIKIQSSNTYGLVYDEDRTAGPFTSTYTIKPLNISRFWFIRKIQLWAINKAIK